MMRTLLLIVSTVVVLALVAGLYVWMQPPTQTRSVAMPPRPGAPRQGGSAPATTSHTQTIIGEGQDVWVLVPDEKTGATKYRFRARRYEPQPDGTVIVTRPEAEFYLRDQIVRLEGSHGRVIMPAADATSPRLGGATGPPRRGELYDVTISMARTPRPQQPVLVATMNNIAFDNDTFRIATDAYIAPDGARVPGDQVPVRIRGLEWDFDGRGLTIRWNDRDQRLELLQIAHGESATIKSPQL
ncbi:MAG TPA: hypothetical protein VNL70_06675, partial [Tepidisphaeraceae bacterium]|nr:hypothetical protein [Tepidisphaeraceae bacterium]